MEALCLATTSLHAFCHSGFQEFLSTEFMLTGHLSLLAMRQPPQSQMFSPMAAADANARDVLRGAP